MRQTEQIMGMPVTVEIIGMDPNLQVLTAVFDYFKKIDNEFSPFKPASAVARLNSGQLKPEDCSEEMQYIIKACEEANRRTGGFFDANFNHRFDPSGYVKGWAIGQAAGLIRSFGFNDFFVEAGGDIQAGGHNQDGQDWKIGIKNPADPQRFAKIIHLSDAAVATSGIYERGRHIYNPLSGLYAQDPLSLSVVAPGVCEADVIATAALAMGPVKGLEFIASQGYEGLAITKDLEVLATAGFRRYEIWNEKRSE